MWKPRKDRNGLPAAGITWDTTVIVIPFIFRSTSVIFILYWEFHRRFSNEVHA